MTDMTKLLIVNKTKNPSSISSTPSPSTTSSSSNKRKRTDSTSSNTDNNLHPPNKKQKTNNTSPTSSTPYVFTSTSDSSSTHQENQTTTPTSIGSQLQDNDEKQSNTPPDKLFNLCTFKVEEDLIQSDDFLAFKGNFGDIDKPSILKIRPSKPKASELKKLINNMQLSSTGKFGKSFGFYKANCVTTKSFNVDVIYPWIEPQDAKQENEEQKKKRLQDQTKVFDKHYRRSLPKKSFIIRETPTMYKNITLPYIKSIPTCGIQWVYDILDEKREQKHIVAKDDDKEFGFVSVPDSKWKSHKMLDGIAKSEWKLNESVLKSLYLLCMVRDRDIKSLRDLRGKHIKLLENLLDKTVKGISEVYGVNKNELRIFVHYPPQYWHFHIHFTCLAGIDYGVYIGKAIFLEDIIDNLKKDPHYYQKANISCVVFEGDKLLQ